MANPFEVDVPNPVNALLLGQQAYDSAQKRQKEQAITDARGQAMQAYQSGDPKAALSTLLGVGDTQGAQLMGQQIQNEWTRKHTESQDAVNQQHWGAEFGLKKAAEGRAAADYENTPDQYAPNPNAGQPGQPAYIDQYAAAKAAGEAAGNGGNPEVGLSPAYGKDAAGNAAAIQFSKTGKAVQTQLPPGFSLSREPIKIDLGTAIQLIDPITRQPIGSPIQKDLAGAEREKTLGDETAKAQVALPQVISNSQQILKTIDDLQNHPGKAYSLGMYSKLPTIPGTAQADFRAAANQLKGQTFLQAYQTLRGGGAITDIEGAKGENALARLDQAQSTAEYDKALNDFKNVIKGGMLRAAAKANMRPATQGMPAPPKIGEVREGHKYTGGNPADPNSWAAIE